MKHNCISNIEAARVSGKKIGFTASSFDLLHPGHILMLAEAKSQCDYLVVGLLTDPTISRPDTKNKPAQSTFERFIQIQAVDYIDELIPFDSEYDLEQMIKIVKPDIRFCGVEYKGTKHTGYDIPGVEHYYNRRDHDYSTTELRNRIVRIFIGDNDNIFDKDVITYNNEQYRLVSTYDQIIDGSQCIKIINRSSSMIGNFNRITNSMFEAYNINTSDIKGFIPFEDNSKNFMGERLLYQIYEPGCDSDNNNDLLDTPISDIEKLVTVEHVPKNKIQRFMDCITGTFTFLDNIYEIDFETTYTRKPITSDYIAIVTKPSSEQFGITPVAVYTIHKVELLENGITSWNQTYRINGSESNYTKVMQFDTSTGNISELMKDWENQTNTNISLHDDSYVLLYKLKYE